MKTNVNFLKFTAIVLLMLSVTSCNDQPEPNVDPVGDPDYYTVTLGFGGEIEVGYEPLVRASDNNDLYGIQVYSTPDIKLDEGVEPTWSYYAYGLFDNVDNLSINLLKGYEYKFVATMVVNGKEKLSYNGDSYYLPFNTDSQAKAVVSDNFTYGIYGFAKDYWGLGLGFSQLAPEGHQYMRPNTERYYGELEGYNPEEHGSKAKIKMKRTSFGAKFIAGGKLAKDGILEILIADAPGMELNLAECKQITEVFTFYFVREAWLVNDYSETINVSLNYIREDGSTLPLGSHNIVFKRNATTVVNVNIENEGENSELGMEITETGEMTEDPETETTITDGEVVDTDVDTH